MWGESFSRDELCLQFSEGEVCDSRVANFVPRSSMERQAAYALDRNGSEMDRDMGVDGGTA